MLSSCLPLLTAGPAVQGWRSNRCSLCCRGLFLALYPHAPSLACDSVTGTLAYQDGALLCVFLACTSFSGIVPLVSEPVLLPFTQHSLSHSYLPSPLAPSSSLPSNPYFPTLNCSQLWCPCGGLGGWFLPGALHPPHPLHLLVPRARHGAHHLRLSLVHHHFPQVD